MRLAVMILAAVGVTAVGMAAERDLGGGMEFAAALVEKDAAKRAGMLLTAAECEGYPSDLALVYLSRSPLPPKFASRLVKLAERRRGELIPALLALRASGGGVSARPTALEAWHAAAVRDLSGLELIHFRELSGFVLDACRRAGEYDKVRPVLEALIRRRPRDWIRRLPPVPLLEFYYGCAFRASGFELVSPEWSNSPHPECRAFVQLLRELHAYIPEDGAEAEALIRFYLSSGGDKTALAVAAEFSRRHPSPAALGMLIHTVIEAGEPGIFDSLKGIVKPESLPTLKASACLKAGDFARAERYLSEIKTTPLRAQLELKLLLAKGDLQGAAEFVLRNPAGISEHERIMALLGAAEFRGDVKYYREAEKLMRPEAWRDPVLANSFGFVALELGLDPAEAERRIRLAVECEPENSAYLDSLAVARHLAGDHSGAWNLMSRALAGLMPHPSGCEILEHAGDIRNALGDRSCARKFYRSALALARRGAAAPGGANYRRLAARIVPKLEALK